MVILIVWLTIAGKDAQQTPKLGDKEIPCAVLENKQRVLTQSGVMKSLGRARQAKGRSYYDGDVNLPAFITAKNLKPFIPNDLYVTSSQIEFRIVTLMPNQEACQAIRQHLRAQGAEAECLVAAPNRGDPT